MKRILITGANSYIGESVKNYLGKNAEEYSVTVKNTFEWIPLYTDFKGYDVVFNVAGIAHVKETDKNRQLYFDVNRDLAINIAKEAKKAGVEQYILLSSMSVYGMITGHITKESPINPQNAYGKSKAEADAEISKMRCKGFKFVCLRPPMVYGKGCKGNYQKLKKFALKVPFFPNSNNHRSMIFIDNLCEFVKRCIDNGYDGLFFPQNSEYVDVSRMVKLIAECNGKKMHLVWLAKGIDRIIPLKSFKKVFGDLTYDQVDLVDEVSFENSIVLSEQE